MRGMPTRTSYFFKGEAYEPPKLEVAVNNKRDLSKTRLIRQLAQPAAELPKRPWKVKDMHGKTHMFDNYELAEAAAWSMPWAKLIPVTTKAEREVN